MRVQEHDRAVAEEDLDWLLENLPPASIIAVSKYSAISSMKLSARKRNSRDFSQLWRR